MPQLRNLPPRAGGMKLRSMAPRVPESSSTAPTTALHIGSRPLLPTTVEAPSPAPSASSNIDRPTLPFTAWSTPDKEIRSFFRCHNFGIKTYQQRPDSVSDVIISYHCFIHDGYFKRALIERDSDFVFRIWGRLHGTGNLLSKNDKHVQPGKLCGFYSAETRSEIRRFCRDNGLLQLRFMFKMHESVLLEVGVVMQKAFYGHVVRQIGYREWLIAFGSNLMVDGRCPELRAHFLAWEETVDSGRDGSSEELRDACTALVVDVWMGEMVEHEDD